MSTLRLLSSFGGSCGIGVGGGSICFRSVFGGGCMHRYSPKRYNSGAATATTTGAGAEHHEHQQQQQQPTKHYDIVINGGGIVGFTFLALLHTLPHLSKAKVLLVEQQPEPRVKSFQQEITKVEQNLESFRSRSSRHFSNRVFAITNASMQLFDRIGIWRNHLRPYGKKLNGMYVWNEHYRNGIYFDANDDVFAVEDEQEYHEEQEGKYLGDKIFYILENDRILRALYQRLHEASSNGNSNIEIAYGTVVTDIESKTIGNKMIGGNNLDDYPSTQIQLKLKAKKNVSAADAESQQQQQQQQCISTTLLIGCDGFKSLVRSLSTLPYHEVALNQTGIVATLGIESPFPHNSIAMQRFIADRTVIGLLPLDDHHCSLVLADQNANIDRWLKCTDEQFLDQLNTELIRESRPSFLDRATAQFVSNFSSSSSTTTSSTSPSSSSLTWGYGVPTPSPRIQPPIITSVVAGSRAAFPLGFGTTVPRLVGTIRSKDFYTRDMERVLNLANTVIMGDAAHRVHPLAGQGLNLGLGDAYQLALELEQSLRAGYDLFESNNSNSVGATRLDSRESLSEALYQYERKRVQKLLPMMAAIHTMPLAMRFTPAFVLSAFDTLPWIKQEVMKFANSR